MVNTHERETDRLEAFSDGIFTAREHSVSPIFYGITFVVSFFNAIASLIMTILIAHILVTPLKAGNELKKPEKR